MVFYALIFHILLGMAQAGSWLQMVAPENIPIWPTGAKVLSDQNRSLGEGRTFSENSATEIRNPAMKIYFPKRNSSQTAIIVFPGGGYKALAIGKDSTIGLEGAAVAKWLTEAGITCVLLKYRVPHSGCYWDERTKSHVTPGVPRALQDAQRAISTMRYHAGKFHLDPNRIGVMGFSAGGNLAVLSSTAFQRRAYEPVDEIDAVSCRPDFAIPVYPGHMTMEHKNKLPKKVAAEQLNTDIVVSKDMPYKVQM